MSFIRRAAGKLFDIFVVVFFCGILIGCAFLALNQRIDLAIVLFIAAALLILISFYFVASFVQHYGNLAWRNELVDDLGLRSFIDSGEFQAEIAAISNEEAKPIYEGLLLYNSEGFIFLSGALSIAVSRTDNVSIELLRRLIWTELRLVNHGLASSIESPVIYVGIRTEPSFFRNASKTLSLFETVTKNL